MTSKQFFTSSIGKKITMGLTGFFLISFLIVHCSINAMIFFNDEGQTFNHWGHFMGSNLLIRTAEIGLFVFLLIHIIQGLLLWKQNKSARPVKYIVTKPNANSKWYSRSMAILGTLLLMFLVMHIYHFWTPSRLGGIGNVQALEEVFYNGVKHHNLYAEMRNVFVGNTLIVALYVLACGSLAYHLLHGFQSAFKTIGIHNKKISGLINSVGVGFSIIVPLLFALMPLSFYFGWIK
jgi:succinate dehydrogenase / fumarate reductase cytochrome b subunit